MKLNDHKPALKRKIRRKGKKNLLQDFAIVGVN